MNGHSETCGCSECYVMRQQRPPAPVAQPEPLILEMNDPGTTVGQLRNDDGRYATQDQAIRQLNATVKALGESIDGLRYDLSSAVGHLTNNMDGIAADHSTLRRDMATEINRVQSNAEAAIDRLTKMVTNAESAISQLTGEVEGMRTAAGKARR